MSTKKFVAFFGFMMLAMTYQAEAEPNAKDFNFGLIVPTEDAAAEAWIKAGGKKCRSLECNALFTIGETMDVMWASRATPMNTGGGGKAHEAAIAAMVRPSVINRRIRAALLSHPDQYPAICRRIRSFTSLYHGDAQGQGDFFFVVSLLQMALLIDKAHPQHCLSLSLAAFPQSAESQAVIASAEGFCDTSQWRSPACHRISR